MRNFYLVRDEEISFALQVQIPNELIMHPPFDSLLTPQGILIPLVQESWQLLDYLETGQWDWINSAHATFAAFLTRDGKLYEYFITDKGLMRRRIPYGKGGWHCRAWRYQVEEAVQASVLLGGKTADIIRRVEETQLMVAGTYMTFKIADLLKMVTDRYPEAKPLPTTACPAPEKETQGENA